MTLSYINSEFRRNSGSLAMLSRITQKPKTRFVYAHDDGGLAYGIEKAQFFRITGISVEAYEVGIVSLGNDQSKRVIQTPFARSSLSYCR